MKRPSPSVHPTLSDLAVRHRQAERLKRTGALRQSLALLDEVHEACPAFVPALLLASRGLRGGEAAGPADARAGLSKAQHYLREAVAASDRSAASMVELGYFLHRVEQRPEAAEEMLRAGVDKALAVLEDGWAGLIDVLGAQGRGAEARELGRRAQAMFPESVRLAAALSALGDEALPRKRKAPMGRRERSGG